MISSSSSLKLDCDFITFNASFGDVYTCVSENLETTEDDNFVTEVAGTHKDGKTDDDVEQFYAFNQAVQEFPGGLGLRFQKIKTISINKCGLKYIYKSDLQHLSKLKILSLADNELESLGPKLFEDVSQLEELYFEQNKLSGISEDLLNFLNDPKKMRFSNNDCVDAQNDDADIRELKAIIETKCNLNDKALKEIADKETEKLKSQVLTLEEAFRETMKAQASGGESTDTSRLDQQVKKLKNEIRHHETNLTLTMTVNRDLRDELDGRERELNSTLMEKNAFSTEARNLEQELEKLKAMLKELETSSAMTLSVTKTLLGCLLICLLNFSKLIQI